MNEWKPRWFGLWDVPPYGHTPYPRMEDFLGSEPLSDREEISNYLKGGRPLMGTNRYFVPDPMTGDRVRGILNLRTDGVWVWADDLADFVLDRPLTLPLEFLDRIRGRNYQAPQPGELSAFAPEMPPSRTGSGGSFWRFDIEKEKLDLSHWGYRWYGLWADPEEDESYFPSIQPFLGQTEPLEDLPQISSYLRRCEPLPLLPERSYFDPVSGEEIPEISRLLSDGVWVWHSSLPDLLARYPLSLPEEFVAHIRANGYVPKGAEDNAIRSLDLPPGYPPLDSAAVRELMAWLNAPPRR